MITDEIKNMLYNHATRHLLAEKSRGEKIIVEYDPVDVEHIAYWFNVDYIVEVVMTRAQRRKKMAEKRHFEDTLFLLGMFVLLIILGQVCLKYGWVIWLD